MKTKMTAEEYNEYVKQKSPKSPVLTDCVKAFIIGGLICCLGEAFLKMYEAMGLDKELSSTATAITMVFLGALFTGLNLYPKLAKFAGAGTIVPITGFANSVVSPAIESKPEGLVLGVGAKIFSIAGPVILFGILASMIAGLVYLFIPALM